MAMQHETPHVPPCPAWVDELGKIGKRHNGVVRPADVVDYARNPETALHAQFTWDDGVAAHAYRLWQARHIIKVAVAVLSGTHRKVQVYVSLAEDRKIPGGGYRLLADIMNDDRRYQALLVQARTEARVYQNKYRLLQELGPIFAAIELVFPESEMATSDEALVPAAG